MTIQTVSLGTAPSGAGGDTFRSTGTKVNENFTNNTHAASRQVGTASGNVMEVGAFGIGGKGGQISGLSTIDDYYSKLQGKCQIYRNESVSQMSLQYAPSMYLVTNNTHATISISHSTGDVLISSWYEGLVNPIVRKLKTDLNTTIDSNGFIKNASPIIKLFSEKIEPNEEALEQEPLFEKVDIGHYLIKNTLGFAKESWWIEVPTDSNGNRICAVEYQTLENGDIEIKTYKKKLNEDGDIVANLDMPIDIPNNSKGEPRWIDIRLHSIPKPTIHKVPRTEKQPRMIQQLKYAMQPSYMTRLTDLIDDQGQVVIVEGKPFQKKETYLVTDAQGIATLTKQPLVNEKGEPVFELVQALDSEGKPIFDDVPVLDDNGNQIYDEVTYEPQQ
ncbi:hypothetical protein [Acinetobacter sp. P8-3-8]|uniref:phage tail fiber protein n=1 Tax=Acinetobacter sp. P8-3-8 TaxID=1029823 RepID=UPI000248557D|nr:hypothetical protein [Acinetobacter sp. P8-3-8]